MRFFQVYDAEMEALDRVDNYIAFKIYVRLRNKYTLYKKAPYDLQERIAQDLDVSIKTVGRALKSLKEAGLIDYKRTEKMGKNAFTFPLYDFIFIKESQEEQEEDTEVKAPTEAQEIKEPQDDTIKEMDMMVTEIDKTMALKQTRTFFEERKNLDIMDDRLNVFIIEYPQNKRYDYYRYLLKVHTI